MPQSIISNTLIASLARLINVGIGLIVTVLLTRVFDKSTYGLYAVLLAYGALLQSIADFGLYLTLTREISEHPERESEYVSHILSLRLVLTLIIFSLGGLVLFRLPLLQYSLREFFVVTVALTFQSISQLFMGIYQKHRVVWRASIGDILGRTLQLITLLLLPFLFAPQLYLFGAVSMFAISTMGAVTVHWLLLPRSKNIRLAFHGPTWQSLVQTSWPIAAMLILNMVYFRIDILLLSFFRSASEVGLYGLAYKIIESSLFFPGMFGGLLLPHLSAAAARHQLVNIRRLLEDGLHFLLLTALLAVIILYMFASPIITLFSPAFASAGPLLSILSFALGVMFVGNLFGFTLVALHRQRLLLVLYAILAVFNIVANLLTIPRYGAVAAAWTTVATEILAMIIAGVIVWRLTHFRLPGVTLLQLGIMGGLTVAMIFLLPPTLPLIIRVGLAVTLYTAVGFFIGAINQRKLEALLT
jgi:O-antigen/teichoic acid export membrane protein